MLPAAMKGTARALTWLLASACCPAIARAQDHEPRRWTHLPVDTNILGAAYAYANGNLEFDPVLRIDDAKVEMHTLMLSYSRYFALFEQTARLDAHVPIQSGRWDGDLDGVPTTVDREGFGDPVIRLSVNLAGAPALRGEEFLNYRKEHDVVTTLGFAVEARIPLGEYDDDKLINLGQNRFAIAPQLGVLHLRGPWSFELTGTTYYYTDNDDFFGGSRLEQDPLYALQAHVVRTFANGAWLSAGVAYGWAGETVVDGDHKDDEKSNLLYGFSFGFRIGERQGVRIGYVRGDTLTDVGSDTHNPFIAWSYRF